MHDSTVPTRVALGDHSAADVDPIEQHVELTFSHDGRARTGIALTRSEARRLAVALMDASAPSFCTGDPAEVAEHCDAISRSLSTLESTSSNPTSYGREDLHSRDFGPYVTVHQLETIAADGSTIAPCEVEVRDLGEGFLSAADADALSRDLSRAATHATTHDTSNRA
ncbi:hypothetical protein ACTXLT_03095 [Brachybacterium alimentarium]|uniref:hypothetical protein n=1 Tax=Brachybacterium alimentarium TaxID=47845 RepID=UPI00403E13F0